MVTRDSIENSNEALLHINDSLVYIDEDVSTQARNEVASMITDELSHINIQDPHPSLENRFLPTNSQDFALLADLYKGEELNDPISSSFEDDFTIGGVDMKKYTNLTTDNNELNFGNLYSSLSHSILRRRSLTLSNASKDISRNKWLINNDNLAEHNDSLEKELVKKRKAVEEVNASRKKQQLEFQPMDNYLKTRWEDGLKGCIEVGVECAKLELSNYADDE